MDKKKLMLLLGALVIAMGTAIAAKNLFSGAAAPQAQAAPQVPQGPKVLVAQRALPVGTIITADSVSFQAWPREMVQDAYFVDGQADMNKLLGTVVRYPITAGQPVTQGALVSPGDRGFLAAALGPGLRAVTIPVSQKTGVGGFVFPGDHVDLVLTQTVGNGQQDSLKTAETILRNVRVLATDQSTENEIVDGKTVVRDFRTVTVEVTPRIAEKVAVAQTIGTISLSLRSLADNQSELDQAIASGTVKVPAGASKEQEEKLLGQAIKRLMAFAAAVGLGYKGPELYIGNLISKRTEAIRKGLPDALDLLVICAEARLTVNAAFNRVARELGRAYPELGDEFALTAIELSFLGERRQAFENLAWRVNLYAVKGVTTTMVQTERYGTPLASALRVLSAEFRNERMMRAEEKAARLPAIMTVPLILFILPVLFVVILGPAACSIADAFSHNGPTKADG